MASAPPALAWPKIVPLLVALVSMLTVPPVGPNATYFSMAGSAPLTLPIASCTCIGAPLGLVIEKTSMGSPPMLLLKPAMSILVAAPGLPAPPAEKYGLVHWNEKLVVPAGIVTVWKSAVPPFG